MDESESYSGLTQGWLKDAPVGTALEREDGAVYVKRSDGEWFGTDPSSGYSSYRAHDLLGRFAETDTLDALYKLADVRGTTVWVPLPEGTRAWAEAVYWPLQRGEREIEGVSLDFDQNATFSEGFRRVIFPRHP